ncbi:hypothetical protein ACWKSP_29495 [Micromonosporaceae bacterium Da 78-11]
MPGDISEQPLARAVLRHLAETRGKDDAMGSVARTVLSGEADLRTAAANPWHAQGLATAFAAAQDERERMKPEQRTAYERQAERLRTSPPDVEHDGNEQ